MAGTHCTDRTYDNHWCVVTWLSLCVLFCSQHLAVVVAYAVSDMMYGFSTDYVADHANSDSVGHLVAYCCAVACVVATMGVAAVCPGHWQTDAPHHKYMLLTACWTTCYAVWYPWQATVEGWEGFGLRPSLTGAVLTPLLRISFSLCLAVVLAVLLSKLFAVFVVRMYGRLRDRSGCSNLHEGLLPEAGDQGGSGSTLTAEALMGRLLFAAPSMLGVVAHSPGTSQAARAELAGTTVN